MMLNSGQQNLAYPPTKPIHAVCVKGFPLFYDLALGEITDVMGYLTLEATCSLLYRFNDE